MNMENLTSEDDVSFCNVYFPYFKPEILLDPLRFAPRMTNPEWQVEDDRGRDFRPYPKAKRPHRTAGPRPYLITLTTNRQLLTTNH